MPEYVQISERGIYRAYGIFLFNSGHSFIRRLRKYYQPIAHGTQAWRASFVLMDYLEHHPPKFRSSLLDVGCGWSPAGVYSAVRRKTKVVGVDSDDNVFPYMHMLASLNNVNIEANKSKMERLTTKMLSEFDLVMGSDICYWDEHVKTIFNLIKRSMNAGVKRFIIVDPGRSTFYELVDMCEKLTSKFDVQFKRWYAVEPTRTTADVLEIKAKPS